jgi:hypothetical protein
MFYLLLIIGLIKPQGDEQAIKTGKFKYNEDLHFTNN